MITGFRHVGIVVSDMDESLRFYCGLLGLVGEHLDVEDGRAIDKMLGMEGVEVTTIKLSLPGGGSIELLHFESHPTIGEPREICELGYTHISLTVTGLDDLYSFLARSGVRFNSMPQLTAGGCKVAFCRDPDGNYIELVEVLH